MDEVLLGIHDNIELVEQVTIAGTLPAAPTAFSRFYQNINLDFKPDIAIVRAIQSSNRFIGPGGLFKTWQIYSNITGEDNVYIGGYAENPNDSGTQYNKCVSNPQIILKMHKQPQGNIMFNFTYVPLATITNESVLPAPISGTGTYSSTMFSMDIDFIKYKSGIMI